MKTAQEIMDLLGECPPEDYATVFKFVEDLVNYKDLKTAFQAEMKRLAEVHDEAEEKWVLCKAPPLDPPARFRPSCPDSGACHHNCPNGGLPCFRVMHCAPLSIAKYPGDAWPDEMKSDHALADAQRAAIVTPTYTGPERRYCRLGREARREDIEDDSV